MSSNAEEYDLKQGSISKFVAAEHIIIRFMTHPNDDDLSGYEMQGHLKNVSDEEIDNVVIDVSYFSSADQFLGLDKSDDIYNFEDTVDSKEKRAFSIPLNIPEDTAYCVYNISGGESGLIGNPIKYMLQLGVTFGVMFFIACVLAFWLFK